MRIGGPTAENRSWGVYGVGMAELEIIGRRAWGARAARGSWDIDTPTPELWLHHSAGNERGVAGVRQIQNFHMDGRGWSDIAYSFLIDRITLQIFEGRGAGRRGGHTFGHNRVSHGICVMGNFDSYAPSRGVVERVAELVEHGHESGWWPAQLTGGHREVRATRCPGDALQSQIAVINDLALGGGRNGDDEMTAEQEAAVRRIQQTLVDAGIDIGASGPNGDGVDGDPGPRTAAGVGELVEMQAEDAANASKFLQVRRLLTE